MQAATSIRNRPTSQLTLDIDDLVLVPDTPASLDDMPVLCGIVSLGPLDGPVGEFAGRREDPSSYGLDESGIGVG